MNRRKRCRAVGKGREEKDTCSGDGQMGEVDQIRLGVKKKRKKSGYR
jgi:hypothetical protein